MHHRGLFLPLTGQDNSPGLLVDIQDTLDVPAFDLPLPTGQGQANSLSPAALLVSPSPDEPLGSNVRVAIAIIIKVDNSYRGPVGMVQDKSLKVSPVNIGIGRLVPVRVKLAQSLAVLVFSGPEDCQLSLQIIGAGTQWEAPAQMVRGRKSATSP